MLMTMRVLQVDIVVSVRNEEHDLAPSVRRLVSYLRQGFPFTARHHRGQREHRPQPATVASRSRQSAHLRAYPA
jgi:hypothetical protein